MTARARVSIEMWENNPVVVGLRDRLGRNLENTIRKVGSGCLTANTTATPNNWGVNNRGFSLRVNSPRSSDGTVAIMSIIAGEHLRFPSRPHLYEYLPGHRTEVNNYIAFIIGLGLACDVDVDVDRNSGNSTPFLRLTPENQNVVVEQLDELAPRAQALADDPADEESRAEEG